MIGFQQKAFYPSESTPSDNAGSPIDRGIVDQPKPLEASTTLDRIVAILASFHEPVQESGK